MSEETGKPADFIYKGRQYFGQEFYDLYNCLHCHTTIIGTHLEQHHVSCEKRTETEKLTVALIHANRECYDSTIYDTIDERLDD